MKKKIGAVIVNDQGIIIPFTVRSTKEQCDEDAREMYGEGAWAKLVEMGAKIVQCEIVLLEDV